MKKPTQKIIRDRILLHLFVEFAVIVTMPYVVSVDLVLGTIYCIMGITNGIFIFVFFLLYYTLKLEVKK